MTAPVTIDPQSGHRPTAVSPATPSSMIERMTLILDAFDPATPTLSLLGLAERTGLPRSTVHRILDQMIRLRWLAHCAGGYRLGMRPLELGGLAADHSEVRDVVNPLLHELSRRTGLVGHLAVLDGREVVYLDKTGGWLAAYLPTRLGGRMPAHSTAVGKTMLATLDPGSVDVTFRGRLPPCTPRTIGDIERLHSELARVRSRHGIAVDTEETFTGITCVAAPLRGHGQAVAALSLSGDTRTLHVERVSRIVLETAREACRALTARTQGRWARNGGTG